MCSLVMSLCSRHYNTLNGNRLTGLTCSKAPGFWVVKHQLVWYCRLNKIVAVSGVVNLINL